jgi:hypothetical protein
MAGAGDRVDAAGVAADAAGRAGAAPRHIGCSAQAHSVPTIHTHDIQERIRIMWLIVLEAALALLVLVLIVWWTMFAGRDGGEPHQD